MSDEAPRSTSKPTSEELFDISVRRSRADEWPAALRAADAEQIVALLARIDAATHSSRTRGLLDSARAMIEIRLTEQLVEQMERLEAVSTRLARAAVVVAVVFGLATLGIGAVQVWLALRDAPGAGGG